MFRWPAGEAGDTSISRVKKHFFWFNHTLFCLIILAFRPCRLWELRSIVCMETQPSATCEFHFAFGPTEYSKVGWAFSPHSTLPSEKNKENCATSGDRGLLCCLELDKARMSCSIARLLSHGGWKEVNKRHGYLLKYSPRAHTHPPSLLASLRV